MAQLESAAVAPNTGNSDSGHAPAVAKPRSRPSVTPTAPREHQALNNFNSSSLCPKCSPKRSARSSPHDPSNLTAHRPSRSLPSAAAPHRRRARRVIISFIFKLAPRRQIWSILCHVLLPRNWKRLVTPHRRLLRRLWPHACPPALAHRGFRVPLGGTPPI